MKVRNNLNDDISVVIYKLDGEYQIVIDYRIKDNPYMTLLEYNKGVIVPFEDKEIEEEV